MYINSPGGVVTAGLAIYDTMQVREPGHVYCSTGQQMLLWHHQQILQQHQQQQDFLQIHAWPIPCLAYDGLNSQWVCAHAHHVMCALCLAACGTNN